MLSFLSPEAKEVLEVLGGLIVVFPISTTASSSATKDLIREVGKVVKEGLGGWEWDGVGLGVGVGEVAHLDDLDVWDEACGDAGLEFVHVASSAAAPDAKNEFGGRSCALSIPFKGRYSLLYSTCAKSLFRENGHPPRA